MSLIHGFLPVAALGRPAPPDNQAAAAYNRHFAFWLPIHGP
jgi:hypothetical protein